MYLIIPVRIVKFSSPCRASAPIVPNWNRWHAASHPHVPKFLFDRREEAPTHSQPIYGSGSRLSCLGEVSVLSDLAQPPDLEERPKRAPGAALPRNGAKRLDQTRGPAGSWASATANVSLLHWIRCLHATCRMRACPTRCMYTDASRFTSWGSTRDCSGLEGCTGTATRNTVTNVQRHKLCRMLCLAGCNGACCMSHAQQCAGSTHAMRVKVLGTLRGTSPSPRRLPPVLRTCRLRGLK